MLEEKGKFQRNSKLKSSKVIQQKNFTLSQKDGLQRLIEKYAAFCC